MPYKRQSPSKKYSNSFVKEDVTENLRWKSVDGTLKVIYTLGAKPIRRIINKKVQTKAILILGIPVQLCIWVLQGLVIK